MYAGWELGCSSCLQQCCSMASEGVMMVCISTTTLTGEHSPGEDFITISPVAITALSTLDLCNCCRIKWSHVTTSTLSLRQRNLSCNNLQTVCGTRKQCEWTETRNGGQVHFRKISLMTTLKGSALLCCPH